jgi:hypothetical protein
VTGGGSTGLAGLAQGGQQETSARRAGWSEPERVKHGGFAGDGGRGDHGAHHVSAVAGTVRRNAQPVSLHTGQSGTQGTWITWSWQ